MADKKINLSNSKLPLEGDKKQQKEWSKKIDERLEVLKKDRMERRLMLQRRYDFYTGNQSSYTTIVGRTAKEKKGHANAVFNYAGKTVSKIAYGLANNPPKITIPARRVPNKFIEIERARSQGVESFTDEVFRRNRFFKGAYRRACFNQVGMADAALKIYPENKGTEDNPDWEIKIVNHERMDNIMVGWRGDDPAEFDYVITEVKTSIQYIKEQYGIEIPPDLALTKKKGSETDATGSAWDVGDQWGVKKQGSATKLPTGKTDVPSIILREYDDENVYALKIGTELVELVFKDNKSFPKVKFWVLVNNIPNPGSPWSIADIDYMLDPQVEFNEASNEERDYIRVGANQKYVAYNMSEFDPESIKTGSGGVIFVDNPDGTSRFEPLPTNVNVFPIDSYLNRVQDVMYDLGLPKVTYGAGGADSGRSKAIDYQSMVDLVIYKRDSWELALDKLIEKIQILGNFYFKEDYFKDPATGMFVIRFAEFDWTDILPITQADKVVNVLNKVTMGLPFRIAFKELGYRDVDSIIAQMKEEAKDPDLMLFRSKMWALTGGILTAQQRAQGVVQGMEQGPPAVPGTPEVNQQTPTLTSSQNEGRERTLPVSQRGGTTSFSSPKGFIARTRQNLEAAGR